MTTTPDMEPRPADLPNGAAAVKEPLTVERQGPPWLNVDPAALVEQLQRQLAAQATEMAAMRVYIDQLHQALEAAAGAVPQENPAPVA